MRAPAGMICVVLLLAGTLPAQRGSPAPAAHSASGSPAPPQAGFRIAGIVVNATTGQPMPSAAIAIARISRGASRNVSQSVVTGADGRFSFTGLAQGKYSLVGRAHGFTFQAFERHDQYSTAIAVGPSLDSEHLVFRLQPDASLEGAVTDENNDPVQFALVRLFPARSRDATYSVGPIMTAQTDDQGHYRLAHLEPGAYYLAVSARPWYAQNVRVAQGYKQFVQGQESPAQDPEDDAALDVTYPLTFYPDATDSAEAVPLPLAPGARETANLVLRAVPSLHLRIHTGEPAQKANVGHMIFPRVSQRIFEGYLDSVFNAPDSWVAPGVMEVAGLAPGHYVIEVPASSPSNEKVQARAWYREIDLASDADINASDSPGFAAVGGTVLFENTAVPHGASIQLVNPETGENFRTDINSHGAFEFNADTVRPGRYLVALSAANFYLKRLVATGGRIAGRALEVGGSASVRLAAIAASGEGQVDGTALHDDAAFSGAMIVLVPQDAANNTPLFRRDQSDSDGTFTLANVVPGQYTVIALANGWDLDWSNPAVLQPYLKHGEAVQVPPDGKLQVKVQVQ